MSKKNKKEKEKYEIEKEETLKPSIAEKFNVSKKAKVLLG